MPRRDPDPRLLTQQQAAAYCGLCVANFKRACPVPKILLCDRIPRYDRAALDRWIDSLDNSRSMNSTGKLERMWDEAGHDDPRARH